jgi:RNA polymerase sigma factor (sigma-70 family)
MAGTSELPAPDEFPPDQSPDLAELVTLASAGDQGAWDELVHRLEGLVWSICRSYRLSDADASDAFQFTWLRLVDKLDTITDPQKLPGWLATTCRRECMAMFRRRMRVVTVGDPAFLDRSSGQVAGADAPTIMRQRDTAVWEAFYLLGAECQRILWVLVIDPPDKAVYSTAAQALSMPTGSLGPKRGRCLEQLKRHLVTVGITDTQDDS